jgi:hypothetical protein
VLAEGLRMEAVAACLTGVTPSRRGSFHSSRTGENNKAMQSAGTGGGRWS